MSVAMRFAPDEADRKVLTFAAAHERVEPDQIVRLLGGSSEETDRRLSRLVDAGAVRRERLGSGERASFRVTSAGVRAIGSGLSAPLFDAGFDHALGVGWVHLAADAGKLGPVERVLSEREMRKAEVERSAEAPFAALPTDFGGDALPHYPDLMLMVRQGRVPVELLLGAPASGSIEPVLRAYAADVRIVAVLFLVGDPWLGRLVQSVAAWLELSALVHVQPATSPLRS